MRALLTGNEAVSTAVKMAKVEVIAAYPITPQTTISEKLSNYCSQGEMEAEFIKVESEHSAMATVVGASSTGVRTFTATSSQGLALMHEMLHWAAGARLPIVMANVNRALGAPWNIWCDHSDSMSQRDTGWLQIYCESCQEVLDTVLIGFRLAESVMLPVMVLLDGFILSHTAEPVDIPAQEKIDEFLGTYRPQIAINPADPHTFHAVTSPDYFQEFKLTQQKASTDALTDYEKVAAQYAEISGKEYPAVDSFMAEDADTILVTSGTVAGTCREVVKSFREQGKRVGLVRVRVFRPLPYEHLKTALGGAKNVAVLDRAVSFGAEGPLCQEIRSVLCGAPNTPGVYGFVGGLGGRDIVPADIKEMVEKVENAGGNPLDQVNWLGVKE